jgi:hypothetical protein
MPEHNFEYDFVISYAGEDTAIAEQLNEALVQQNADVFFAPDRTAEIWGANLFETLASIYSKKGLFCVPLVSKAYVEKQWTKHEWKAAQERALKEQDSAYILPIRIDDTPLPGLFETTAYLDLKSKSIEEIAGIAIQKLQLYKDNVHIENPRQVKSDQIWEYVGIPNQRSQYLTKNNYLDRSAGNFADNMLTSKLYDRSTRERASNYCTFISIPHPESLFFDIDTVIEELDFESKATIFNPSDTEWEWQKFHFQKLNQIDNNQEQIIRINPGPFEPSLGMLSSFLIDQFGSIEFSTANDCNNSYSNRDNPEQLVMIFHLVTITGMLWKFINIITHIYHQLEYTGKIQVIVNLKNTESAILSGFANANKNGKHWVSRTSNQFRDRIRFESSTHGISSEKNIQLVYEIDAKAMKDNVEASTQLINHFSRKLQRSFNYPNPPTRHYVPDTSEFPWRQFYQYTDS